MKKLLSVVALAAVLFGAVGCKKSNSANGSSANAKTVSITSINESGDKVQVAVPANAQRIVVLDLAALDIIDNLGLGDKVVGTVNTNIDYLKKYVDNKNIVNCGTVKEVDFEKILGTNPDVIFAGGRLQKIYNQLAELAPTVIQPFFGGTTGLYETIVENTKELASVWGKEDETEKLTADFATRIDALKKVGNGKTAIVALCTNGGFNVLGNNTRCSIIGNELGFKNVGIDYAETHGRGSKASAESQHGNEVSFEFVVQENPDYIFVLDRDSAIGAKGAKLAKDILNNELVNSTDAAKNGNVVIFAHPEVWYTAEGGVTAFDVMLKDLEERLLK